jgi:exosome complex RNA-binding protein Rrp42 (RNase PH superfamily)
VCQPPNSPDLNVLDLGFFAAIQALQHKETPKTVDVLIGTVVKSFETYSPILSNKIFLTLQTCMVEVMKRKGSNRCSIPRIKKDIMLREGRLPTQIKCDPLLYEEVVHHLRNLGDDI